MDEDGGFPDRYLITNGAKLYCIKDLANLRDELEKLQDCFLLIVDTDTLLKEVRDSLENHFIQTD